MWFKINSLALSLYTRLQLLRDEKGQAMVEYTLIVALISIIAVVFIGHVGEKILTAWENIEAKF